MLASGLMKEFGLNNRLTNGRHARSGLMLVALTVFAAVGAGCSSSRTPDAAMGVMGQPASEQLTSLGAGDALGRIVYVNDTVLAMGGSPAEFWAMHNVGGLAPMTTLAAAMELRLPSQFGPDSGREGYASDTIVNVPEPADLP
jgi:hypothetical protein